MVKRSNRSDKSAVHIIAAPSPLNIRLCFLNITNISSNLTDEGINLIMRAAFARWIPIDSLWKKYLERMRMFPFSMSNWSSKNASVWTTNSPIPEPMQIGCCPWMISMKLPICVNPSLILLTSSNSSKFNKPITCRVRSPQADVGRVTCFQESVTSTSSTCSTAFQLCLVSCSIFLIPSTWDFI